jgi:hypothetical protein
MKKQPVKRKYTKRATKNSIKNLEWVDPKSKSTTKKDTEVESLALICSIFDGWSEDQKRRNLTYLASRYYDFL